MISVLMPTYNASRFIKPAIESILRQTFTEFEFIIIDDGSQDDTVEIVKNYLTIDRRIILIEKSHTGISDSLNVGIKQAKYQWIARMDADDIALPERLAEQMKLIFRNPNIVVCGTYAYHINQSGQILSLQQQGAKSEQEYVYLYKKAEFPHLIHPTWLFKKEIILRIGGYDPRFVVAQDLELLSRASHWGLILAVPKPLLLYRIHRESKSVKWSNYYRQQLITVYVRQRDFMRLNSQETIAFPDFLDRFNNRPYLYRIIVIWQFKARFYYRKAGLSHAEADYLSALAYLLLALVLNPIYSSSRLYKQKLSYILQRSKKLTSEIN